MRWAALVAGTVCLAMLLAASTAARVETERVPEVVTFKVRSITDGDTIRLANGKRVRLLQIDAPELQEDECYAAGSNPFPLTPDL